MQWLGSRPVAGLRRSKQPTWPTIARAALVKRQAGTCLRLSHFLVPTTTPLPDACTNLVDVEEGPLHSNERGIPLSQELIEFVKFHN